MSGNAPLSAGKLSPDLLGRLLERHPVEDPTVVVGPGLGRDAAVVKPSGDLLVVKTDPITFATDRAARHLVQINANDIACMGATPRWLVVTALFGEGVTTERDVEDTFEELQEAAAASGVTLVGGHTEITIGLDRLILVGCMFGEAQESKLLHPGNARPGHRLLLTRTAGIEGTALLASEMASTLEPLVGRSMVEAAARFIDDPGLSIVREARILAESGVVSALHDPTEGGVAMAVRELAAAARTGAVISEERVPVTEETRAICTALDLNSLGLLSSGALLASVPAERGDAAESALGNAGVPYSWIGKLTSPEAGCRLRTPAGEFDLPVYLADEVVRGLKR